MRYSAVLWIAMVFISCSKDHAPHPSPNPGTLPEPVKKVLLKDIEITSLPSPYYHFEYNSDSTVVRVNFASGFSIYDVLYSGSKIAEMRNNIIVNHDTVRYVYDNTGKLSMLKFINQDNVLFRHVTLAYDGPLVKEIDWDQKQDNGNFLIDRTLTFTYLADGNVKTITEHRPGLNGAPEINSVKTFDQYDDKVNVDDFSLIHDTFHDHLFLFQGFRLQKNNPGKEAFTQGAGLTGYTIDYTYTYNSDGTPSTSTGEFLFTSGSEAGIRSQTHTTYTYY